MCQLPLNIFSLSLFQSMLLYIACIIIRIITSNQNYNENLILRLNDNCCFEANNEDIIIKSW